MIGRFIGPKILLNILSRLKSPLPSMYHCHLYFGRVVSFPRATLSHAGLPQIAFNWRQDVPRNFRSHIKLSSQLEYGIPLQKAFVTLPVLYELTIIRIPLNRGTNI